MASVTDAVALVRLLMAGGLELQWVALLLNLWDSLTPVVKAANRIWTSDGEVAATRKKGTKRHKDYHCSWV